MNRDPVATAILTGGVGLLERAVNYTLGSLHLVGEPSLSLATPCTGWTVRDLLVHLDDSLTAMYEAVDEGCIGPLPSEVPAEADPRAAVRENAVRLVGAWSNATRHEVVSVAGLPLTAGIVTGAGAIETAVHGWDLSQACGLARPLPAPLAEELLELAPLFIS
ncbi:MAG: TIGR03086 family protein, partial [Kitasatospora sp.]|nr:TIGR03086 family protein [Kitasatospora sp.]